MTEVREIVDILIDDPILIRHWKQLYLELGTPTPSIVQWEDGMNNRTLSVHQLFTEILINWKSKKGNLAKLSTLYDHLTKLGYNNVADNLNKFGETRSDQINLSSLPQPTFKHPTLASSKNIYHGVKEPAHNFVGREKELKKLNELFLNQKYRFVLVCGLGGIGKTELVTNFVKQLKNSSHVTWFSGDTSDSLRRSIIDIANCLGIKITKDDHKNRTVKDVWEILTEVSELTCNRRWIIVIDNLDEIFDDAKEVLFAIKKIHHAFVVVTSRNRSVLGESASLEIINELNESDAQKLVQVSLNTVDGADVACLCKVLQCFPLALQQAIAYIIEQQRLSLVGESYNIKDYLNTFEVERKKLLDHKRCPFSDEYGKTTLCTWNITIDKIKSSFGSDGQIASEILQLLAFVDPLGIEVDFLNLLYSNLAKVDETQKHNSCVRDTLKNANPTITVPLGLLKKFSLVKVENSIITIHRLVQDSTRLQLPNEKTSNLLIQIISGIKVSQTKKEDLPHLLHLWKHLTTFENLPSHIFKFPDQVFDKQIEFSLYHEADKFAKDIYQLSQNRLGISHEATLRMEHNIAIVTKNKGFYKEALSLYNNVYEKSKKLFGEEHELTLMSKNNKAVLLFDMGKYPEATELYRSVLTTQLKVLGKNHKHTIATKLNLATVLQEQGQNSEATQLSEEILEWHTTNLGDDHPITLTRKNNFAVFLVHQNKHAQAKKLFESVLRARVKTLGDRHASTLNTKYLLAVTLLQLGYREEAIDILKQVLFLQEEVLGENHPHTINTRSFLQEK